MKLYNALYDLYMFQTDVVKAKDVFLSVYDFKDLLRSMQDRSYSFSKVMTDDEISHVKLFDCTVWPSTTVSIGEMYICFVSKDKMRQYEIWGKI